MNNNKINKIRNRRRNFSQYDNRQYYNNNERVFVENRLFTCDINYLKR